MDRKSHQMKTWNMYAIFIMMRLHGAVVARRRGRPPPRPAHEVCISVSSARVCGEARRARHTHAYCGYDKCASAISSTCITRGQRWSNQMLGLGGSSPDTHLLLGAAGVGAEVRHELVAHKANLGPVATWAGGAAVPPQDSHASLRM